MASDREQFCLAVRTIYEFDSKEERTRAEQWLETWQRQSSAWETAAGVLDDANSTDDERFMAAQTLRTKTQRDFEELSPEQASGLQNTLVTLLIRYGEGLKPVRTQLCVAIASLAVHLPASSFGEAGVIGWLYMKLNAETNPSAAVVCLLELLITLPQEVRSNRVAVRPERRRQAEQEMKGFFEPALQALHGAWSHSGERVLETVLRALAQWLNLTSASGISCDTLRQNELVRKAFEGLADPQLFDSAVDCLDELIWCTVSLDDPLPRIRGEMMPLIQVTSSVQELVSCIMSLRPRFHVALQRALNDSNGRDTDEGLSEEAKAMDHDDDDTVRCMVRLFLDITDAYQILVAQGSAETITPLEGVLEICSHPDWDTFSMALGTIGKIAARVTENPPMPECMERIKNIYFSFVTVLGKRVRFSDNFAQQSSETRRQFKHIRYEIEDVLKDIVAVLGPDALLEVLASQLSEALTGGTNGIKDWKDAEAAYFCMKALADQPPQHCNPRLLQVLRSVNSCADNEMIQFTACTLIHKFSCWLANSAIEDTALLDLVPELFRHTINSLGRHMSAGGASLAFAALCRDCTPTVGEKCSQDMLSTFERAASTESANWVREGPAGAAVMPLEEEDICSIVEGTATVLAHAASQGSSEAEQSLGKCIELLLRPLAALVQVYQPQGGFPTDDRRVGATATDGMHRVAMFAQHLSSCPSFIGGHLPHLWEFIVNFMSLASQQEAIVESSLKVIMSVNMGSKCAKSNSTPACRKSIGAAQGHTSEQWLPGILSTVPQAYKRTHFSAYLYLASHVVRSCGTETSPHRIPVAQAVTPMIQEACSRLASLSACNQSPHDADDLFLMAYKGLSHAPSLFLDRGLLEGLLRVAAVGLLVHHQDAFRSIQSFLFRLLDVQTLSCAPDQQATQVMLRELLMNYGPPLVRLELGAAVGLAAENRIPDMAGTFLQLLLATAQAGQQWLQGSVALLPDIAATAADKELFVQRVSQACAKSASNSHNLDQAIWDVQEALSELSRTCRRNPNVRLQSERALAPQELWPDLGLDGR